MYIITHNMVAVIKNGKKNTGIVVEGFTAMLEFQDFIL